MNRIEVLTHLMNGCYCGVTAGSLRHTTAGTKRMLRKVRKSYNAIIQQITVA